MENALKRVVNLLLAFAIVFVANSSIRAEETAKITEKEVRQFLTTVYGGLNIIRGTGRIAKLHNGFTRWEDPIVYHIDFHHSQITKQFAGTLEYVAGIAGIPVRPAKVDPSTGKLEPGTNFFIAMRKDFSDFAELGYATYLLGGHDLSREQVLQLLEKQKQYKSMPLLGRLQTNDSNTGRYAILLYAPGQEKTAEELQGDIWYTILVGLTGAARVVTFDATYLNPNPEGGNIRDLYPLDRAFVESLYSKDINLQMPLTEAKSALAKAILKRLAGSGL